MDPLQIERQRAVFSADDARAPRPRSLTHGVSSVFEVPLAKVSLKKIAWAFGCSKKGSEEEQRLRDLLVSKVREVAP
jgi:hypothetical protein